MKLRPPSTRRFRVTKPGEGPFIVEADRFVVTTLATRDSVNYHARFFAGETLVAFVNYPASIVDVTA